MYKRIISTAICVIALITVSLLSVSATEHATDVTTTATIEQPTEENETASVTTTQQSDIHSDIHNGISFIIGAVGMVIGCKLAQGLSFWKW